MKIAMMVVRMAPLWYSRLIIRGSGSGAVGLCTITQIADFRCPAVEALRSDSDCPDSSSPSTALHWQAIKLGATNAAGRLKLR